MRRGHRLMRPSIPRIARFLPCLALLTTFACGDDGGGGGTEGSSTGGTGSETEAEATTSTDPSTTTSGGEGSSGSSGPDEGSTTTAADGGSSETGGSTGSPGDCEAQADQETCETTMGCLWLGSMQNGVCLLDDPSVCPGLDMMQCQQHPACDWDNQAAECVAAM